MDEQKKEEIETADAPHARGTVTLSILSEISRDRSCGRTSLTHDLYILEAKEPAFLRRLRAQETGGSDTDRDPHRHQHPAVRPRGTLRDVDDDDGPVIVDERGDVVASEEYERLEREDREEGGALEGEAKLEQSGAMAADDDAGKRGQSIQEIGKKGPTGSKRKAVRIVGAEDEGDAEARNDQKEKTREKPAKKKAKKKVTLGTLSFNYDGDG